MLRRAFSLRHRVSGVASGWGRGFRGVSCLHRSASLGLASVEDFERAVEAVPKLREDPGNAAKLDLYALYKVATQGPCSEADPGMFSPVKRAKWKAWTALGDMSPEEAREAYIAKARELGAPVDGEEEVGEVRGGVEGGSGGVGVEGWSALKGGLQENGVFVMQMNRPEKLNAISLAMYNELVGGLEEAAADDRVRCVVWVGSGRAFSAGTALDDFASGDLSDMDGMVERGGELLERVVGTFIDFPKPLVAGVNGPAVGIAVTLLGLCDLVYSHPSATFHTPFSQLGQSAEACSSYTFPLAMGPARASEMLLLGTKYSAAEMQDRGIVTALLEADQFQEQLQEKAAKVAALPPGSLRATKQLVRGHHRHTLHAVNKQEVKALKKRWQSQEFMNAVMSFLEKK